MVSCRHTVKFLRNFVSSETCIYLFLNFGAYHRPHGLRKPSNIYIKMCVSAGNGVLVLFFPIRVTIAAQYSINYGKNTPFKFNEET